MYSCKILFQAYPFQEKAEILNLLAITDTLCRIMISSLTSNDTFLKFWETLLCEWYDWYEIANRSKNSVTDVKS